MDLTQISSSEVLTVAGASLITTILVEIILRAWQPPAATKDRFGPLIALGVAVVLVTVATVAQNGDILQGVLTGILAGWSAMGIHDTVSGTVDTA